MPIKIPNLSLVALVGVTGSGKSTFAAKHFRPTEVISSDACRAAVGDDANDQSATPHAFDLLHFLLDKRLELGRLTVIDATNVQPGSRKPLVAAARRHHCVPVAVVLDVPEAVCRERNRARPDRDFGPHVVRKQRSELKRSVRGLKREGFRSVFTLDGVGAIDAAAVERVPTWTDRRHEAGPFDIIGDLHGCRDELDGLLAALGYAPAPLADADPVWGTDCYRHPEGRRAVFLGDLVDRGPRVLDTVRVARNMVAAGSALCVPGNHDVKFARALAGRQVRVTHGLETSIAEIDALPEGARDATKAAVAAFLDGLVSHAVLDGGRLVVAHAGLPASMHGRASGAVREFCLYGDTTGETDAAGLPVRRDWAADYRGDAAVVYGHTAVEEPRWVNRTVCIDTGCVFGGRLTALRYPENEFVSVAAKRAYAESGRPRAAAPADDGVLDIEGVTGKRIVATRLMGNLTTREENNAAALEVMSRFAADPRWLIYLPPTMSPTETSDRPGLLEHPAGAFAYYRSHGVPRVVCQEKHMGSRAVAVVCRDGAAARDRFGVGGEAGVVLTRTGRRFFNDAAVEAELLARLRAAMTAAGFWDTFATGWACLDCELMPWSAKAQGLIRGQYAAVGSAGRAATAAPVAQLERAAERLGDDVGPSLDRTRRRRDAVARFTGAYRRYCWPVASVDDLKLAPFHLLATEGRVHTGRDHMWHTRTLAAVCGHDPGALLATDHREVDVTDPASEAAATAWWEGLTGSGGEGMVVKPLEFIARGKKGLLQPAVKCRGPEYLRIIYGPDYDSDENLPRLRQRALGRKRSLALREFALGVEALERFVRREPPRRVHECAFAVLALETEPVDPRL